MAHLENFLAISYHIRDKNQGRIDHLFGLTSPVIYKKHFGVSRLCFAGSYVYRTYVYVPNGITIVCVQIPNKIDSPLSRDGSSFGSLIGVYYALFSSYCHIISQILFV